MTYVYFCTATSRKHKEMAQKRLSEKEIEQLLAQYRGERRKLIFQLETVRAAIADLKAVRDGAEPAGKAAAKRGPGSPAKRAATTTTRKRKPGRRKKRQIKDGGYRLSPWGNVVVQAIEKSQRLLPKADLLTHMMAWAKKNEPKMKAEEVEMKLTRVLQKLSGKRGVLGTYRSGLRRGYHYGLKSWFFATSGKLRKQHLDKLVLTEN